MPSIIVKSSRCVSRHRYCRADSIDEWVKLQDYFLLHNLCVMCTENRADLVTLQVLFKRKCAMIGVYFVNKTLCEPRQPLRLCWDEISVCSIFDSARSTPWSNTRSSRLPAYTETPGNPVIHIGIVCAGPNLSHRSPLIICLIQKWHTFSFVFPTFRIQLIWLIFLSPLDILWFRKCFALLKGVWFNIENNR